MGIRGTFGTFGHRLPYAGAASSACCLRAVSRAVSIETRSTVLAVSLCVCVFFPMSCDGAGLSLLHNPVSDRQPAFCLLPLLFCVAPCDGENVSVERSPTRCSKTCFVWRAPSHCKETSGIVSLCACMLSRQRTLHLLWFFEFLEYGGMHGNVS